MPAKVAIGSAAALVLAGATWLVVSSCSIDPTVKEAHRERDLKAEEVRAMLIGGDFKKKLEAQKQIDKLAPDEKLAVLETLSKDADPAVRLIAVKKLKPIDDPRAKRIVADLAANDPDETVREVASSP